MNQKGFVPIAVIIVLLVVAGLAGKGVIETKKVDIAPQPSSDNNNIKVAGKYSFGGDRNIEYEFALPKNGGSIIGKIGGMCEGLMTGVSQKPDAFGKSKMQGVLNGTCQLGPLPFKAKLEANFEGFADFKDNNVNVNYKVTQPITTQSNLIIPFTGSQVVLLPQEQEKQTSGYKTSVTPSQVNMSGRYEISDTGIVDYNLSIPRQAGTIIGTASGDCNATISGQVGELDSKGIRQMKGDIKINCKPMVSLGNKTELGGTFWGPLDDKKGEIEVIHNGVFEKDSNSVFFINYTP